MKNVIVLVFALFTLTAFGQKKVEEVIIHTTAECGSCKKRIEGKLNYTKGIKFAELDIPSKNVTVKFQTKKISLAEIKNLIAELGYDADDVKANQVSYDALPQCCKIGGMEHTEEK